MVATARGVTTLGFAVPGVAILRVLGPPAVLPSCGAIIPIAEVLAGVTPIREGAPAMRPPIDRVRLPTRERILGPSLEAPS